MSLLSDLFKFAMKRIDEQREATEKAHIARGFNYRYTYRTPLISDAPYLVEAGYGGHHSSGYAWMCPECNRVHHPIGDNMFTGLRYPACCGTREGDRLNCGIRYK